MENIKLTDSNGEILVKIIHRKNGEITMLFSKDFAGVIDLEVRDSDGKKVYSEKTACNP